MEKHNYPCYDCTKRQNNDYDLDYHNLSYSRCRCSHECCCGCHRSRCHCRRDLCADIFKIRLSGLTDGLSFRLHQLLWCEAMLTLDNGNKVEGRIVFVGSNFIEMLVEQNDSVIIVDQIEEELHEADNADLNNVLTPNHVAEEYVAGEEIDKREHKNGQTWIVPILKIVTVELPVGHDICNEGI